ncbi:MAG TPA: DUF29 family protein [Acetobacteraceae bacterium]|nr:DUF29 family protein [Acetobacteraceae bacterium]
MDDRYDGDILTWSERQAGLLRHCAANSVEWESLADEDVGRSQFQLRAVRSRLAQALLHELKAQAWPQPGDRAHWRAEARGQRDDDRAAVTLR